MATVYVRTFNLKDSLSDAEILEYWRFGLEEATPAIEKVSGVRSVKWYSGAGALRADLRLVVEMDDAGVYERALVDPTVRRVLGRFYGGIDLKSSTQRFLREITPELIGALSSTD